MLILASLFLMNGCAKPEIEVTQDPKFCNLYEPRKFSQQEIDWRSANAPWNLRRDITNNKDFDDECAAVED